MSLDPSKQAKLQAFLAALPEEQAGRLLAACEAAEGHGGTGLPLELVREALAHRADAALAHAFGAMTPLVRPECGPKRIGRITRTSLDSVAALAKQIAPNVWSALAAGEQPVSAHREILGRSLRAELRNDDGAEFRYRTRMGGERGYRDACDISALLCAEPELSDGLSRLPQRIEEFDNAMVGHVLDLYEQVTVKDSGAPLLLLFLVLERLEKRAQILRVLKRLVGQDDDLMAAQTDIGAIGDTLLDEAGAAVAMLSVAPTVTPDGPAMVAALGRFASISRGMTRELGIRRDGMWGQRLKELRFQTAQNMDIVCAAAAKAIDEALPQARMRLDTGAFVLRPDTGAPPHEAMYARGLNFAIILGGVAEHASPCAFTAEYNKAREAAERIVHAYCEGIIELLQYAGDDMLPSIEPWRDLAEQFTAGLLGESAKNVFRRRSTAARMARARAKVA